MKRYSVILFMLSAYIVFGQHTITGRIYERYTEKSVQEAHILFNDTGVLTDTAGYFRINCKKLIFPLKLTIRHIQYKTRSFCVDSIQHELDIPLDRQVLSSDEVTVYAEKPFHLKSSVPAKRITKNEIESFVPAIAADVLRHEPGISVKSEYQSPIVIRGLSGKRTLILRNGNRRFSSYPAGFMTHTVNIYDLEKIEVQKGPASVQYGSGAIAGVINLVDKSPFKKKGLNLRMTSGYASNNREKSQIFCGGWSNGTLAVKGAWRKRNADAWHDAKGQKRINSQFEDENLYVTVGYRINSHEFRFNGERHRGGPWGKPVGFSGTQYLLVNTPKENSDHSSFIWNYAQGGIWEGLNCAFYFASEKRVVDKLYLNAGTRKPSYYEQTFYSDDYYGARIVSTFAFHPVISLTSGAEYYRFHISSPMKITDYFENHTFQNLVTRNARSGTAGCFVESDLKLSPKVTLRSGLRYDATALFEGDFFSRSQNEERTAIRRDISGMTALQIRPGGWNTFKINCARTFRIPTVQEMFVNTYTANGVLYGNPDLLPETSWNIDLGWLWSPPDFHLEISPFFWLLENMINREIVSGMPGLNYEYINTGRARIWGGEIAAGADFKDCLNVLDKIQLNIGAGYTNGTDITSTENPLPLNFIPPFHVKSTLACHKQVLSRMALSTMVRVIHYSRQLRLPENEYSTPTYTLISWMIGLKYKFAQGYMDFKCVVNNVANVNYHTFQSFIPGKGRDVRLLISFAR